MFLHLSLILFTGGPLSRGLSVQEGSLSRGIFVMETTPGTVEERVVCILLECILVMICNRSCKGILSIINCYDVNIKRIKSLCDINI